MNLFLLAPIALFYFVFNGVHFTLCGEQKLAKANTQFPITSFVNSSSGHHVYVGMNVESSTTFDGSYALCQLRHMPGSNLIVPLCPPTVYHKLNAATDQFQQKENPLFGQPILHMTLMEDVNGILNGQVHPVLVVKSSPHEVHITGTYKGTTAVLSATLLDAHPTEPKITNGIVSLAASNEFIFAAVKPHNNPVFGQPGSGIAYCISGILTVDKAPDDASATSDPLKVQVAAVYGQLDAPNGVQHDDSPRALPLDCSTKQILIGSSKKADALGQKVAMAWSKKMNCLYVGLDVQSDNTSDGGVQGIMVVQASQQNGLSLEPIAKSDIFEQQTTSPVGACGPYALVKIHQLHTLYTSTCLSYLIVLGGTTDAARQARCVYAMPLVTKQGSPEHGMLAANDAPPVDYFTKTEKHNGEFISRGFELQAKTSSQLPQEADPSVRVGGGNIAKGTISCIATAGDVVFITVVDTDQHNSAQGIYRSRALFNSSGAIKGWTNWQRATSDMNAMIGAIPNLHTGQLLYLAQDPQNALISFKLSDWINGKTQKETSLAHIVSEQFGDSHLGILGAHDFAYQTPGLPQTSIIAFTGMKKILLVQTSLVEQSDKVTIENDYTKYQVAHCSNGTINTEINSPLVSFAGGALDELGAIGSAAIVTDTSENAWLVVAGVNGVAILSTDDGMGWNVQNGIGNNFSCLTVGMSFKKCGNYRLVKKVVADSPYLYLLTSTNLYRIDMRTVSLAQNNINQTIIATSNMKLYEGFLDLVVSGKLAVLATNKGLLRIGNNSDVRNASNPHDCHWTQIKDTAGSVLQLEPISQTGIASDVARGTGGMIYALNANRATRQSHAIRLSVAGIKDDQAVDDSSIRILPDMFKEHSLSYLINFSCFRSKMASDGIRYMCGNSHDVPQIFDLTLFTGLPAVRCGERFVSRSGHTVNGAFSQNDQLHMIGTIWAWGEWFAVGSFGMIIHQ